MIYENQVRRMNQENGQLLAAISFGPKKRYEGVFLLVLVENKNQKQTIVEISWPVRWLVDYYLHCLPDGYQKKLFDNL